MSNEFDPFTESQRIGGLLSATAVPAVRKMVAGLGGVEKVFHIDNRNLYIQEYMAAVAMFHEIEKIAEPPNLIHGVDPRRHASIAFRNGMKLPILAAKGNLRSQTFQMMAELGSQFLKPAAFEISSVSFGATEDLNGRVLGYGELGYQMLHGAYEPLVDKWEDELTPRSGYGIHVRQGVGFVAALASEVNEHYLRLLTEAVIEEAFPDTV